MMDALSVLVMLGVGFILVKKKLLPRLKKGRQENTTEQAGGTAISCKETPDFRVLSFCSADFTYADDLGHCVEYELGKNLAELSKEGCTLLGDPFPVGIGNVLLIVLYYTKNTVKEGEVEG